MQQRKVPSLPSAGKLLAALVATGVLSVSLQQPAEANAGKIRKFGFDGTYRGIVVGSEASRTQNQATMNTSKVSRLHKEQIPSKPKESIDGLTEGKNIRVLTVTRVRKRRLMITSYYFGISNNTFYGEKTVASGSRSLVVRRKGDRGEIFRATLTDRLIEKLEANGAVAARLKVSGKLRK